MPRIVTCIVCGNERPHYAHDACRRCYARLRSQRLMKDPVQRKRINDYQRAYIKKRYAEDPEFRERHKEHQRRYQAKKAAAEGPKYLDDVFEKLMEPYRAEWASLEG